MPEVRFYLVGVVETITMPVVAVVEITLPVV